MNNDRPKLELEDWMPMEPAKGPPLPRLLNVLWPWWKPAEPLDQEAAEIEATVAEIEAAAELEAEAAQAEAAQIAAEAAASPWALTAEELAAYREHIGGVLTAAGISVIPGIEGATSKSEIIALIQTTTGLENIWEQYAAYENAPRIDPTGLSEEAAARARMLNMMRQAASSRSILVRAASAIFIAQQQAGLPFETVKQIIDRLNAEAKADPDSTAGQVRRDYVEQTAAQQAAYWTAQNPAQAEYLARVRGITVAEVTAAYAANAARHGGYYKYEPYEAPLYIPPEAAQIAAEAEAAQRAAEAEAAQRAAEAEAAQAEAARAAQAEAAAAKATQEAAAAAAAAWAAQIAAEAEAEAAQEAEARATRIAAEMAAVRAAEAARKAAAEAAWAAQRAVEEEAARAAQEAEARATRIAAEMAAVRAAEAARKAAAEAAAPPPPAYVPPSYRTQAEIEAAMAEILEKWKGVRW